MRRIKLPLIIVVLGFILPYYWDSVTNESVALAGYVFSNVVGIVFGIIMYCNAKDELNKKDFYITDKQKDKK